MVYRSRESGVFIDLAYCKFFDKNINYPLLDHSIAATNLVKKRGTIIIRGRRPNGNWNKSEFFFHETYIRATDTTDLEIDEVSPKKKRDWRSQNRSTSSTIESIATLTKCEQQYDALGSNPPELYMLSSHEAYCSHIYEYVNLLRRTRKVK